MKVILHIGWRKTGTSAIQYFLYTNRARLRERHGILFPETGLFGKAHHLAGWRLVGQRPPGWAARSGRAIVQREGGFAEMAAEAEQAGCRTLLLSSEVFSQGGMPEKLAAALRGHEVQIISYLRRQDRFIEARYNQRIKDGRLTMGLAQFAQTHLGGGGLDYYEHFERWARYFGRDALRIRVYDRERFPGGDVRRDFLDALGLDGGQLDLEPALRNVSLNFAEVEFLRRFNSVSRGRIAQRPLVRLLSQYDAGRHGHSSLFSPDDRRAVIEPFRPSNARLAREFLRSDSPFEIFAEELAREAQLDRDFGESEFLDMLAFVVPRLLSPGGRKAKQGLRKKARKAARTAARP